MLRCPKIGTKFYLMASLQEECFTGRHFRYVMMLTIPQIILCVLGLPIIGTVHLLRNKDLLKDKQFQTRYGLLYVGYRPKRAWWELVVAFRKVAVVAVGTFGTLLGVVDVQAHLALLVVFLSIVAHLIGQPFDMERKNTKLLHNLELAALSICWLTFWGGLLFFLGHEQEGSVADEVKIFVTVIIVGGNVCFLIGSICLFAKEYRHDKKIQDIRRSTAADLTAEQLLGLTTVVPVNNSDPDAEIVADGNAINNAGVAENEVADPIMNQSAEENSSRRNRSASFAHLDTHLGNFGEQHEEAQLIHDEFHIHEEGLRNKTAKRQQLAKRKTQLRLIARTKLKDSKALHLLPTFSDLEDEEVDAIIDKMDHLVRYQGDTICHQHDVSDSFYVIVKGAAKVTVDVVKKKKSVKENDNDQEKATSATSSGEIKTTNEMDEAESRPEQFQVAELNTLDFFGENALLLDEDEEQNLRTATVVVTSEKCVLLRLKRSNFLKLDEHAFKDKHHDHDSIMSQLKEVKLERTRSNRLMLEEMRSEMVGEGGGGSGGGPTISPKGLPNLGLKSKNERSLFS